MKYLMEGSQLLATFSSPQQSLLILGKLIPRATGSVWTNSHVELFPVAQLCCWKKELGDFTSSKDNPQFVFLVH